jgi:putative ubiquitin-RnfH superfamily antitoxin RatB of RatAB toxin-antitoxin module
MRVEVAYAGPEGVAIVGVELTDGASVADAIEASGLVPRFGLIDAALGVAIFGQAATRATPLRPGDRVELLRPLHADPKDARRRRARDNPLPPPRPRPKRRRPAA